MGGRACLSNKKAKGETLKNPSSPQEARIGVVRTEKLYQKEGKGRPLGQVFVVYIINSEKVDSVKRPGQLIET